MSKAIVPGGGRMAKCVRVGFLAGLEILFCLLLTLPMASLSQDARIKSIHQLEAEAHRDLIVPQVPGPPPVPLAPEVPANLTRTVFGFYPYWAPGFAQVRFQDLTHLAVFSAEADGTGRLVNLRGWPNVPLIQAAHQANVRVVLVCTLFNATEIQSLLSSPTARQTLIANLRDQVVSGGADGVNIDFEGVPGSQRVNLVAFMQELANEVRAAVPGAHISIDSPAVDWSNAWDYAALSDICDALMIMCYDYYWSGSAYAGPVSPLQSSSLWGSYSVRWSIADYLSKVGSGRSKKLLLGVPYYGYDWPVESDALKARALGQATARIYSVASTNADIYGRRWDNLSSTPWYFYIAATPRQVWYEDSASLSLKYDLVFENALQGVGIWALTYDRDRSDLWKVIEDRFGPPPAPEAPEITAPATFFSTAGLPVAIRERGSVPARWFEVAVGTTPGGVDVSDFKSVGLRRQNLIQGLGLKNGTTYYVTARSQGAEGVTSAPSSSLPVTIDTSGTPDRRFIPHWISSNDLYTGLALVNSAAATRAVLIRGHVAGRAAVIETSWVLKPGEQFAQVISERDLFGSDAAGQQGWLEVLSQGEELPSIYLVGDTLVSRSLAGSVLMSAGLQQVVPELDGGNAEISIVNTADATAQVRVTLRNADGSSATWSASLAAGELLARKVTGFFPGAILPSVPTPAPGFAYGRSPFISVESDKAIACTSLLQRIQDSAAVAGLHASAGIKTGAFPYVLSGGGYRSQAVLVNPSAEFQTVECSLLCPTTSGPVTIELPPRSAISADTASLFGLTSGTTPVGGALRIDVKRGLGVHGSVWLRSDDFRIMAALPLEPLGSNTMTFPHLAQAQGYWTGMSLANPGASAADVVVEAVSTAGTSIGKYAVRLSPGEVKAGLIYQWIPSSLGLSAGRIEVRSTAPILAAEIFGSDTLSFMAAIPKR